ncbi:hypothetical protein TNIN_103471 [Trichonephila inaurata madagascariensis]|uniref:DDE Tnp4 domain-containing protein n=1 Tax=Trichonephila inaurata madagascariensis TaxID=2747483 RepID=A0A8X6YM26_9ARAC|nr:hypothetical protein TNIN_103471 [Trichonephila inaurata madagascariensis]
MKRRKVQKEKAPLPDGIRNESLCSLKLDTKDIGFQTSITLIIGVTESGSPANDSVLCFKTVWRKNFQRANGSGFSEQIRPSDVILADRGFPVKDLIAEINVSSVLPTSSKDKNN